MKNDYNKIKDWLLPLLDERDLSVENFSRLCGLSRQVIYFYLQDKYRPNEQHMARMCEVLGRELEEGLRQYTPRPEGRPKGSGTGVRELRARR